MILAQSHSALFMAALSFFGKEVIMNNKTLIVGTFPPSKAGLAEYSFNMVEALAKNGHEIIVLADKIGGRYKELDLPDNVTVKRCWKFNSVINIPVILFHIFLNKPNIVWFNFLFTTFSDKRVLAFLSSSLPVLCRLSGFYSLVTLHHIFECMNFEHSSVKKVSKLEIIGTQLMTRLVLKANRVVVTLKTYKDILEEKYKAQNVARIPHGYFSKCGDTRATLDTNTMLIFGKFGTYKKVEPAIKVFEFVKLSIPNVKLVIAGTDHPSCKGYLDKVREDTKHVKGIQFLGYIPERDLEKLFKEASLVFMPYLSNAGASGVLHNACVYGLPVVCPDLPDFKKMAEEEKIAIDFHGKDNLTEASLLVRDMLCSEERRNKSGRLNFLNAQMYSMNWVISKYLNIISIDTVHMKSSPSFSKYAKNLNAKT